MNENDLLTAVLDLARVFHWRTYHARPARDRRGWSTPLQGTGVGWPDLVMLRHGRLVVAELKSEVGKLSDSQSNWLSSFRQVGAEVHIWRPEHWHDGAILATLRSNQSTRNTEATHDHD